jgi:hypothetical protein
MNTVINLWVDWKDLLHGVSFNCMVSSEMGIWL